VKLWLAYFFFFFLALNANKTEVILFGPSDRYDSGTLDLDELNPHVTSSAKNLGFLFDSGLKFDHQQINSVIKSYFFHLRHLAKVKSFLSPKNFEIVIHAFITIVDYCNSLYLGAIHLSMGHLKLVQNAAARKV